MPVSTIAMLAALVAVFAVALAWAARSTRRLTGTPAQTGTASWPKRRPF